ncbi:hypothetical protein FQN57_004437 [Myotisia sp. PD_48]|nr:hypothetical protein FQN57_004437 [Myotisia sp. PD_48]
MNNAKHDSTLPIRINNAPDLSYYNQEVRSSQKIGDLEELVDQFDTTTDGWKEFQNKQHALANNKQPSDYHGPDLYAVDSSQEENDGGEGADVDELPLLQPRFGNMGESYFYRPNMSRAHYTPNQEYARGGFSEQDNFLITGLQLLQVQQVDAPSSHDYPLGHFTCPEFFKSNIRLTTSPEMLNADWDYSMRREAQMMLPFLFLGPTSAARDPEFLRKAGITLLFAIRSNHPSHTVSVNGEKPAAALGIESDFIASPNLQGLIALFPEAIRRINNHLCQCPTHRKPCPYPGRDDDTYPKKVLVFCETGNERSAVVVAAYLMVMFGMSAVEATANVQARRLCVNVNLPARETLHSFRTILDAQQAVTKSLHAVQSGQTDQDNRLNVHAVPRKRSFDISQESNAMDQDSPATDQGFFRSVQAPFRDTFDG